MVQALKGKAVGQAAPKADTKENQVLKLFNNTQEVTEGLFNQVFTKLKIGDFAAMVISAIKTSDALTMSKVQ